MMNYKGFLACVLLLIIVDMESHAQGFLSKLAQKARQAGEKVVDKAVDDLLNSNKQPAGTTSNTGPGSNTPYPGSHTGNSTAPTAPVNTMITTDTLITGTDTVYHFNTATITPKDFVNYALTLKGTPYVFGSADPAYGLDCSGFVTHVFNHFNIAVPRRTYDFKNAEHQVTIKEARPGDLILFTGIDASNKIPGHMGIITAKGKDIQFIHASSGQAGSVTTAMLSYAYFKTRLLTIVRVF